MNLRRMCSPRGCRIHSSALTTTRRRYTGQHLRCHSFSGTPSAPRRGRTRKKESCGHFRNRADTSIRHAPQGERDVPLNRDNAIFIDSVQSESRDPVNVSPLNLESRRSALANVKPLNAVSTRHPEFPLELLCSHKHEAFQLTFARNAQQHFLMREDVEVVASHYGLMIRGETEDAIDAATIVLRDLYGPSLRIGAPMVRYHDGTSFEQPWMGLSVKCAPEHYAAVKADLI